MKYAKFVWKGIPKPYYILNPIFNTIKHEWRGNYYYSGDKDLTLMGEGGFPIESMVEFAYLKQLPNSLRKGK